MPIIPSLGRLGQKDLGVQGEPEIHSKPVSKTKQNPKTTTTPSLSKRIRSQRTGQTQTTLLICSGPKELEVN